MQARNTVNTWLSQLNPNDPSLVLDTSGQCQLIRKPGELCTVFVPADTSPVLVLYSHISHLPEALQPAHYEALLALNTLGIKTLGCTLGLDPHFRSLMLSYSVAFAHCDLESFCTAVDNFFTAAEHVRGEIGRALKPQADSAPSRVQRPGTALQQRRFVEKG